MSDFEQLRLPVRNEFHDAVRAAARSAYAKVRAEGRYPDSDPHCAPVCVKVAGHMLAILSKRNLPLRQEVRDGWNVLHHSYLVLPRSDEGDLVPGAADDIVADPTWQQFLDEPNRRQPKVMIGTREQVLERFEKAGVPEGFLDLWVPPHAVHYEADGRIYTKRVTAAVDLGDSEIRIVSDSRNYSDG